MFDMIHRNRFVSVPVQSVTHQPAARIGRRRRVSAGAFLSVTLGVGLLIFGAAAAQAQAQVKLGTVDLQKVFDGYWKTKQADGNLKERAGEFDKIRKGYIDEYQKANELYQGLIESANDQAVSAEERNRRKQSAETKLLEIREIESNIQQFDKTSRTTLGEQQRRMRDNLLREIREVVDNTSRSRKFSLVIDTAAQTPNQTPIFLYFDRSNDITDEVLTQLNANAPASFQAPAAQP